MHTFVYRDARYYRLKRPKSPESQVEAGRGTTTAVELDISKEGVANGKAASVHEDDGGDQHDSGPACTDDEKVIVCMQLKLPQMLSIDCCS